MAQAQFALTAYSSIPIRLLDVDLALALEIASGHALYSYDAYLITCLDMKEFTYSEARQQLAALLDRAHREGAVRIRRRDGQVFVLSPEARRGSPLDVPGINLDLQREEIVDLVHESRRVV